MLKDSAAAIITWSLASHVIHPMHHLYNSLTGISMVVAPQTEKVIDTESQKHGFPRRKCRNPDIHCRPTSSSKVALCQRAGG
ncbi:hypothetical protein C0Q70_15287 [Pomacea canaliculata]|uniref:Uncharacterized protein n=1 Tax=Pomacea canaliculata TaxID=400727 RepID=A0A2T7NUG5_POMCA|nr:hypothetical protein C0Q70_15287 [Pomacea canaliculata]